MVKLNNLKARMAELEMGMEEFAKAVDIHVSTLYRKMRAPEDFYLRELRKIKAALQLSPEQMAEIFFDD